MWRVIATSLAITTLARGEIVFERPTIDLGKMRAQGTVSVEFAFQVRDTAATIVEARPSCGCLKSLAKRTTYPVGMRGAIPLEIHAASQPAGSKRYLLNLTVRDPSERTILLAVNVEWFSDFVVEPANLIIRTSGGTVRHEIRVTDRRPEPISITGVRADSNLLTGRLVPSQDAAIQRIAVEVAPNVPMGTHTALLEIETNNEQQPKLEVPVTIVRQAPVRMVPESLRLHSSEPGGLLRARAIVESLDPRPIQIARVTSHEAIRVEWPLEPAKRPRLELAISVGKLSLPWKGELVVETAAPVAASLVLPISIDP